MVASKHQRNVRAAMEGNIAAYFHPHEERIAFLYPNGVINIFDSRTFENVGTKTVQTVWANGSDKTREEMVETADMSMVQEGYDRKGRSEGVTA